ncbi:MAPEG family protein [Pseudolabrys taiwanensis]|uniref:MAPEG family protein n=1 Tax=Pseudolabrys taiwanensis TaxID=331696 RepID=A0A346A438_9HYPH|nr:MAPEG family protein [Pseudolabrys taiwanensis]AXK83935.1 MAPEG family protein [Pseudolabrys taiwanensis]
MPIPVILMPLFVEVLLTFGLLIWLVVRRSNDLNGGVRPAEIALGQPNWPARTLQVGNSYASQFELPVLFYVLTILSIITRHADIIFVVLAWVFVLLRLAHAYVHTTGNNVRVRGSLFAVGMLVLLIMWVIFIVRILLGLP